MQFCVKDYSKPGIKDRWTKIQNNRTFEADRLRNAFDIRNKDPATLTIYQREQLKRYQEASAVQQELQDKRN